MLQISDLTLTDGKSPILADINASFQRGTLTTILGRTGAGKTSLMRSLAGLLQPDAGRNALDGKDWQKLAPWSRPVAMVTQQFINYPHLTALDNVAFPLIRQGMTRTQARAKAQAMLERVGLAGMTDRRPGALSGGQQQRVAIARALVKRAPVLLLDEPFVSLDYKLREGLREELVDLLQAEADTIVLYASTEPRESLQMGDQVILMAEGRIVQSGRAREVFSTPASRKAAEVVNDPPMNMLAMAFDVQADLGALGRADLGHLTDGLAKGRYTLGLRAGDVMPGGDLAATVTMTEVSGSETLTHLDIQGLHLVMHEKSVINHELGTMIGVRANLAAGLLFDQGGAMIRKGGQHG